MNKNEQHFKSTKMSNNSFIVKIYVLWSAHSVKSIKTNSFKPLCWSTNTLWYLYSFRVLFVLNWVGMDNAYDE